MATSTALSDRTRLLAMFVLGPATRRATCAANTSRRQARATRSRSSSGRAWWAFSGLAGGPSCGESNGGGRPFSGPSLRLSRPSGRFRPPGCHRRRPSLPHSPRPSRALPEIVDEASCPNLMALPKNRRGSPSVSRVSRSLGPKRQTRSGRPEGASFSGRSPAPRSVSIQLRCREAMTGLRWPGRPCGAPC